MTPPPDAALAPERPASSTDAVALHWGFSDPRSPVRVAIALPPALRIALGAQLAARGGRVVEGSQGLSSFHPSVAQAVQAALEIFSTGLSLLAVETAPIALRAVIVPAEDGSDAARGAALTRAYRLIGPIRDHRLLLTRGAWAQLDPALRERARLAVAPALADEHPDLADLFDLDWASALQKLPEVTGIPEPAERAAAVEWLELTHGGTQLRLSARDCPFTLGRDKSCSLHLDGDVASRVHGRIEFAHDKFYFADDSRNGTYLLTPQGEEVFLHRERLPLLGRGVISPGAPIVKQTGEVLRYVCRHEGSLALFGEMAPAGNDPVPDPEEDLQAH